MLRTVDQCLQVEATARVGGMRAAARDISERAPDVRPELGPITVPAVEARGPARAEALDRSATFHRETAAQRALAGDAGRVRQRERDPTVAITRRVDVDDLPERDLVQIEQVGPDIEQGAALEPPAPRVRAAGKERTGEETAPATERVERGRRLGEGRQARDGSDR